MDEELKKREVILEMEERILEKGANEILELEELCGNPKAMEFMRVYAQFKDAVTKARQVDLEEKKEDAAIIGSKLKLKLGLIIDACKVGLTALALWFELKKGTIFGGFMLKKVMGNLTNKTQI